LTRALILFTIESGLEDQVLTDVKKVAGVEEAVSQVAGGRENGVQVDADIRAIFESHLVQVGTGGCDSGIKQEVDW